MKNDKRMESVINEHIENLQIQDVASHAICSVLSIVMSEAIGRGPISTGMRVARNISARRAYREQLEEQIKSNSNGSDVDCFIDIEELKKNDAKLDRRDFIKGAAQMGLSIGFNFLAAKYLTRGINTEMQQEVWRNSGNNHLNK